ncbi:MAG TPA: M23 family metallopeptidase [Candidatus Limnocylindrales bacterium]|jgi:murein DD-endopeptidase MepM/ murein hydrolase activator NlpD
MTPRATRCAPRADAIDTRPYPRAPRRFAHAHPAVKRRRGAIALALAAALIATSWAWLGLFPGHDTLARLSPVTRTATATREAANVPTHGPQGDDVGGGTVAPGNLAAVPAELGFDRSVWLERRGVAPEPPKGYRWPLRNATITNDFGRGLDGSFVLRGKSFHDGLDIATWCGDRIRAAHDGVVLAAGRKHQKYMGWIGDLTPFKEKMDRVGWGGQSITVVIDDRNGYRSGYSHLSRAIVKIGQVVRAGDLIGYEGETGNATGCHLHYTLFNPNETETLRLNPRAVELTKLPGLIVARINPFEVLPPMDSANMRWGWDARIRH